ncbi:hypothetical protein E2C01_096116 [Portunus trituberculatus]|uniref:Uncharacterized protein n=1 Tax=Portunus trituberculatus TaxID=210409 RepID=A0A5B7JUT4_PORTR|nr:hypothetical protein [Portunus trituberculatus]
MEGVTGLFTSPEDDEGARAGVSRQEAGGDSPHWYDESLAVRRVSGDAPMSHDNGRDGPSEGDMGRISPGRSIVSRGGSQRSSPTSSIADSVQSAARLEEL